MTISESWFPIGEECTPTISQKVLVPSGLTAVSAADIGIHKKKISIRNNNNNIFLMAPHPLTNFEIQKNFQSGPKYKGAYSQNNLPNTMKVGDNVVNLDENKSIGLFYYSEVCIEKK